MKSCFQLLLTLITITLSIGCNQVTQNESAKDTLDIMPKAEWEYKISNDEMYDTKVHFARIHSDTSDDNGIGLMNILIRHRDDDCNQVFLALNYSSFDFGYGKRNYVLVRFDKEAPIKYTVRPLESAGNESVGFSKPNDFIKKAKTAKTILIEAPIFNESIRLFKFEMDNPLKWDY